MESRKKVEKNKVSRELIDEQSPELLKELHLLTRDGHLNADARRKLKQVNHLYNLIRPALDDLFSRHDNVSVVDVGAGKAYLGFIIYELAFKNKESGQILSIEDRSELMNKAKDMAARLKFDRMQFIQERVENYIPPTDTRLHLVTALHACDTATDDALKLGITSQADYIAVVPCCQAEVARLLNDVKPAAGAGVLGELWEHGIHRREFGSHLTNVMRALVLEAFGYQVTVTELVGWEHSLKNEFIFAKRVAKENPRARKRLDEMLEAFPVKPKLVRELLK